MFINQFIHSPCHPITIKSQTMNTTRVVPQNLSLLYTSSEESPMEETLEEEEEANLITIPLSPGESCTPHSARKRSKSSQGLNRTRDRRTRKTPLRRKARSGSAPRTAGGRKGRSGLGTPLAPRIPQRKKTTRKLLGSSDFDKRSVIYTFILHYIMYSGTSLMRTLCEIICA